MLIFTCIVILKYWGGKYRWLSAFLVVMILLLLIFLIRKVCIFFEGKNNKTEEWIDIQEFSTTLKMDKVWKLQSYPEIIILSDIDGEILSLNVGIWDIVEEYQILMQIENDNPINSDYDEVWEMIQTMYENYDEIEKQYKEFQSEYWDKIKNLEKQLFDDKNALIKAIEFKDTESRKILEDEIEKISEEYKNLKTQQDDLKNKLNNLDSEAKLVLNENDKYYYEMEKQTPRAPFSWVIWNIYVNEWEVVKNWDKLITIINNNFTPEILINLDFDEYLLTKDLTWVSITIENENRWDLYYDWEIYSRSPILNDEWKYTITVKIIDEHVPDLILNDDNSQITVIFTIDSTSKWIPTRCFQKIWKDSWILTLRDGEIITWKEVWIKNKWENWINIDNLALFWLEKEEEKDWIELCIEDWNKIIKNWDKDSMLHEDESLIEWHNQFDNVEDLCREYIKENPKYRTGHRNSGIISELWWSWEKIEILCDIE